VRNSVSHPYETTLKCISLYRPAVTSLSGANNPLNTLFPNTYFVNLKVRNSVSHPYETTLKSISLYRPAVTSLSGANNTLNTLFPNTYFVNLKVRNSVSHPYETTLKNISLYRSIVDLYVFRQKRQKESEQNCRNYCSKIFCWGRTKFPKCTTV
jgi:hypothetical protein